jgi:uracil-DNA glycosylase
VGAVGKLDRLDQQVRACRLCRLCRTRFNGVPGDGNDRAEILFIGEGPGYNEDREGKPFVGAAGQFLDELLGIAGLRRPDVYITNVVKCRPPQNRDPLPDEIDACAPYLDRQIALIDPALIVTLGRFSMGRFFPNDRISAVHGQARPVDGRVVMTMWHPAYGLRDAAGKESLKDDFRKIPAVLEQARELRARRSAAPPAPVAPDFVALVEASLPAPPPPEAPAAAPEPTDSYAYLAAVNGHARQAPAPRPSAARQPAGALEAAPAEAVLVAPEPVAAPEGAALVAPGLDMVGEPAAAYAAPTPLVAPAKPRRARKPAAPPPEAPAALVEPAPPEDAPIAAAEAAAEAAPAVDAAPPAPAPPRKGKPEPDARQLSLF